MRVTVVLPIGASDQLAADTLRSLAGNRVPCQTGMAEILSAYVEQGDQFPSLVLDLAIETEPASPQPSDITYTSFGFPGGGA